ncbi:CinA family protein [Carnimonas bestiolae]|uniref:CinA family protein n=1 Tax=Carnimonas bestiolae TaxID=3402172 RepID=UPI003EDC99A5
MADLSYRPRALELASRLGELATAAGIFVTTAESCTGGGVATAITSVSGSSRWFGCGFITYSNEAKQRQLGVKEATIKEVGAVSAEVVKQMVAGACHSSGATLGVAISGIAGPGGGSPRKPVGTVFIAWGDQTQQQASRYHFSGDREAVRAQAVDAALEGLIAQFG